MTGTIAQRAERGWIWVGQTEHTGFSGSVSIARSSTAAPLDTFAPYAESDRPPGGHRPRLIQRHGRSAGHRKQREADAAHNGLGPDRRRSRSRCPSTRHRCRQLRPASPAGGLRSPSCAPYDRLRSRADTPAHPCRPACAACAAPSGRPASAGGRQRDAGLAGQRRDHHLLQLLAPGNRHRRTGREPGAGCRQWLGDLDRMDQQRGRPAGRHQAWRRDRDPLRPSGLDLRVGRRHPRTGRKVRRGRLHRLVHGRNGQRVVLPVPPGTVVRTSGEDGTPGEWIGELMVPGSRMVVAHGGRGGRGNVHFATATRRAPTHAEKGEPGEGLWIELELKLIADIGLVGAPNAGKSTLLAALTAATPAVGAYPFTTTVPNLGVIEFDDERRAVIADLPGLIEGAHEGRGLGHEFLRHVERTRVLVGVIDGAAEDPVQSWESVASELGEHDPALLQRPLTLVVTKQDLPEASERWPRLRTALKAAGSQAIGVSAQRGTGLAELRRRLAASLAEADAAPPVAAPAEMRIHRFDPLEAGWEAIAEGG